MDAAAIRARADERKPQLEAHRREEIASYKKQMYDECIRTAKIQSGEGKYECSVGMRGQFSALGTAYFTEDELYEIRKCTEQALKDAGFKIKWRLLKLDNWIEFSW